MKALLLVDLQNDFLPGGALAVPLGDEVLPIAARLMPRFELVVATQDWHPANHGSFAANHPGSGVGERISLSGLEQVLWPVHCVADTRGAAFAEALDASRIHYVIRKGTDPQLDSYSGFFDNGHRRSTGLKDFLHARGVDEVFVMGLATDYCVKFTALDARRLGFRTVLVSDGCRGVDLAPGDSRRALDELRRSGVEMVASRELLDDPARLSGQREEVLACGRFLKLVRRGRWEYVDRMNASGAVMIAAVTLEGKLILTEQFREPLSRHVIELPAGLVGDDPGTHGEAWATAAKRELLEETGYEASEMTQVAEGPSSAGLATEQVAIFLARGLKKIGEGGGVAHEAIQVHEVPLDEVRDWLEARRRSGTLIDPRIFAALYFIKK